MLETSFLAGEFERALPYERYVQTGTEEQQRRWQTVYEATKLNDAQRALLGGFVREMNVLVVSGIWCGDCVQQCPLQQRIAEANPQKIHLRLVDRDQHRDLSQRLRINNGDRVPVAVFMAEDFVFCAMYGDRSINRYRAVVARQLGAFCPVGIVPPAQDELNATLKDWLDEFERIQLMLRLSHRLRQKYGD